MADLGFRLPPTLDLNDGNLAENFKKWRRQLEVYLIASGASAKSKATQTAIILHCGGPQVVEIYDQFEFEPTTNKTDPTAVLDKIKEYCNPKQSEVLQRFRFWNIPLNDKFDTFLTQLRTQAAGCNFAEKEKMIRDKIVFSARGKLQELLLRESELDLDRAIDICRTQELTTKHLQEMNAAAQPEKIEKIQTEYQTNRSNRQPGRNQNFSNQDQRGGPRMITDCDFCGQDHRAGRRNCPAWGKTCNKCQAKNHFAIKCRKAICTLNENCDENDSDLEWLAAVSSSAKSRVTALMQINNQEVRFQLDSGADVNTICQKYVRREQVRKTKKNLIMWNKSKMEPVGETTLEVTNPKTGSCTNINFIVVPNDLACLLGLTTVQELNLLTVNEDKFVAAVAEVETLGDLGQAHLHIDPATVPKALPCRRLPLALTNDVHKELDNLVARGVLIPVDEPTPWVSQMAVVRKANKSLRICIDPQPLNEGLMREHYKLPTIEDVLPCFNNAKLFTKLDIKEAFWHIKLDEESSKLTTMLTPFGRYRWSRLPFGLKVSSEIFQKRLQEAIGDLTGVVCVADDIIVMGYGETMAEAEKDHEQNLYELRRRCQERNVRLNNEKEVVKQTEIVFMGHRITQDGVKADDAKVQAIKEMSAPTDVHGVKRWVGMIQYLAKFLPNLSQDIEPIRELTKKDVSFHWSEACEDAFRKVKDKVSETPVLVYFDPDKELSLQVDSSQSGVGAVLLQEGRPIEYASRALTDAEQKWAQIEKEALSVLYGLEHFDQYTYGRQVTVQNDHKPLATILKKPLSQAPKRLQALMMKLYRYDVHFQYIEGKKLFIADTLSRAYLQGFENEARVMKIDALQEFPDAMIEEVKQHTEKCPTLQKLLHCVVSGWPSKKNEVPDELKTYYDIQDTLSHQSGVLLKGERIIIPKTLKGDIKSRLHASHLGYDSLMRRARQTVYWPGMSQEIKQMAETCAVCQEFKPRNQKETLQPHEDGHRPWEKVGVDLFEIKGRHYLVTIDYYTNFIEADYLSTTTTTQVITKLKSHFARFGIPTQLVSDCGPQFTADEFKNFVTTWGISHKTSSPGHHQSNGKAESAVKVMKTLMYKTMADRSDQYLALLELRNTPRQDTGLSPAQMMFRRSTRSLIPCQLKDMVQSKETIAKKKAVRRKSVKSHYDKHAKDMPTLVQGQPVFFQYKEGFRPNWEKGTVYHQQGERSYIIEGENGGHYQRNRVHIRPRHEPVYGKALNRTPTQTDSVVNPGYWLRSGRGRQDQ